MKRICPVVIALTGAAFSVLGQPPDPKELVVQSIANYDHDWRAGMQWGYTQHDVTKGDGTSTLEVSEVIPIMGTPYEKLISKNGQPLTPEEQRREDQKYEKTLKQRQNETPAEHTARIQKYENERSFLKDLPNAYDFKMLGEDTDEGQPAWVIGLTPRADFVPTTNHGAMLKHIQGRLWIDKEAVQWAKAEAFVVDPITIGWIVARIGPGARIFLDMTKVNDSLWMPSRITINGSAKVLMVHNKNLNEELVFSGYHADNAYSSKK